MTPVGFHVTAQSALVALVFQILPSGEHWTVATFHGAGCVERANAARDALNHAGTDAPYKWKRHSVARAS